MKINIKARHIELPDDIVKYCKKRMAKFSKLLPANSFFEVEFIAESGTRGGLSKRVQIDISIPGEKNTIHLDNSAGDWQSSIDFMQDRLENEIKRLNEKSRDHTRYPKKYHAADISIQAETQDSSPEAHEEDRLT